MENNSKSYLEVELPKPEQKSKKNKMHIIGGIASALSICMYVSYIP